MNIPSLDLTLQFKKLEDEIMEAVSFVMRSGQFILGPWVEQFELDFASYCGCKFGVGVASGTDALVLALDALGIGVGDEVITTPFTFIATAEAISRVVAVPVFVDIDPRTFCIDAGKIEEAITFRTKAILPVHLYGHPCDMDKIMSLAWERNLFVIEDCAQAHGAEYKGRKVGSFGKTGCFSFFPSKNLGAYGDAGMILTDSSTLNTTLNMLRKHGTGIDKYHSHWLGYNSRLDAIQAAVLNAKLKYLDEWNRKRREIAAAYNVLLDGLPLTLPREYGDVKHVYHQYVIRVKERDELVYILRDRGIDARSYFPISLHKQDVYLNNGSPCQCIGSLEESELAAREVVSLPMYPELTMEEQRYVCGAICDFFDERI